MEVVMEDEEYISLSLSNQYMFFIVPGCKEKMFPMVISIDENRYSFSVNLI
jgi:hypothetical protein